MAVKTYSYKKDKDVKLSEHFKVSEIRCKDGTDKILVDLELAVIGEKLRSHFNAKSVNITSGYRSPAHDKKVGGSGSGYHTKGQAWDIYILDKNKNRIPAKYICCYLQDLGVKGIGYINSTCVHYDTRSKRYWFDETKGNKSIGNDFYSYFGVKKSDVYPEQKEEPKQDFEKIIEELNKKIEDLNLEVKNLNEELVKAKTELDEEKIYKFSHKVESNGRYSIDLNIDEILIVK
jgi:hypothetical protein